MNEKRILCAAIHVDDGIAYEHQPTETGYVLCGYRHHNIINSPVYTKGSRNTQGFLTSSGEFVGRNEAYKIAHEAGQIIRDLSQTVLYSESIY